MKKGFLALLLCFCTVAFGNIEGQYKVTGHDPNRNQDYSGSCVIKKAKEGVYEAEWTLENGAQFIGTGLVLENTASFIFVGEEAMQHEKQENAPMIGLQTYRIEGTTLRGKWVLGGGSVVGDETMERMNDKNYSPLN